LQNIANKEEIRPGSKLACFDINFVSRSIRFILDSSCKRCPEQFGKLTVNLSKDCKFFRLLWLYCWPQGLFIPYFLLDKTRLP
jgi:hypothetical protein